MPGPRPDPLVEIARHVRRRGDHREAEEALRGERQREEPRAQQRLDTIQAGAPPAPSDQERPSGEQERKAVREIVGERKRTELTDRAEQRVVAARENEVERLPQGAPTERIHERHRQRGARHGPQAAGRGTGGVGDPALRGPAPR